MLAQHLTVVVIDACQECTPLAARSAIVHEEMRTVFVRWFRAATGPMVVWHDMAQGDAVFDHQIGGELRGAIERGVAIAASMLAHFNADAVTIARAIEIGVFALFIGGHVLQGDSVIDGEMPDQIANAIAAAAFGCAQSAIFERLRMLPGIGAPVLRAVNGDEARLHRAVHLTAMSTARHHVLAQVDTAHDASHARSACSA